MTWNWMNDWQRGRACLCEWLPDQRERTALSSAQSSVLNRRKQSVLQLKSKGRGNLDLLYVRDKNNSMRVDIHSSKEGVEGSEAVTQMNGESVSNTLDKRDVPLGWVSDMDRAAGLGWEGLLTICGKKTESQSSVNRLMTGLNVHKHTFTHTPGNPCWHEEIIWFDAAV